MPLITHTVLDMRKVGTCFCGVLQIMWPLEGRDLIYLFVCLSLPVCIGVKTKCTIFRLRTFAEQSPFFFNPLGVYTEGGVGWPSFILYQLYHQMRFVFFSLTVSV